MRAIDTNVLVRLLVRDDHHQAKLAAECLVGGAWVSLLVLAETFWVLESTFRHGRAAVAISVDMLLKHESLTLQDPEVVLHALRRFQSERRVEFADCLIVEIARRAGHTPLITFDRDLAKLKGVERLGKS